MWEYRENDKDDLVGPFSTSDMFTKLEEGIFKPGTRARRIGTEAFYDVKRIDFDLFD
jgi:hypothetical protein